jgi:hypothetical protein
MLSSKLLIVNIALIIVRDLKYYIDYYLSNIILVRIKVYVFNK